MTCERMTADEAETIRQLAQLTGRSIGEIMRAIRRSPQAEIRFAVAVLLATGEWDWLDRKTGEWRTDRVKQLEKLQSYADNLLENDHAA